MGPQSIPHARTYILIEDDSGRRMAYKLKDGARLTVEQHIEPDMFGPVCHTVQPSTTMELVGTMDHGFMWGGPMPGDKQPEIEATLGLDSAERLS